jgi:hypothetical protein
MSIKNFNYSEPAELFGGGSWRGRVTGVAYRRFDTAAEAILYAVEELPDSGKRACILEVDERRFNSIEINKLYDSTNFPLRKKNAKDSHAA